jgi:hypothetical protein
MKSNGTLDLNQSRFSRLTPREAGRVVNRKSA